jgi:UDPglucose--hexose-1-phosphate uridylyltransferase
MRHDARVAAHEVRIDPVTGRTVVVAGDRQDRPNLPASCPFCPGGTEAPGVYDVRWFPNRWPALPDGRSEVVLFTSEHEGSLGSLAPAQLTKVVDLWAERTASLGQRPDVDYVLIFENRGEAVGATISHPHGQIYAFDAVPPAPLAELDGAACALCTTPDAERLVSDVGAWRASVPFGPTWPYELLLAPIEHVPDLPSASGDLRAGLVAVLRDALPRLDRLFDEPMPYMLWLHQRPTDGGAWPTAHLHVHVAPLLRSRGTPRYVAAGELGSGVWFDPIPPERAAADLRRAR